MATSAGEVEVKLTLNAGDFKKTMGDSKAALQDFSGGAKAFIGELAGIFSFAAIADFFKKSLEAYAEQEAAMAKLTRALENHGLASESMVKHLEDQSRTFEQLTGVEDNLITSAQTVLINFGLQGAAMDKATKAALDLSAATGIDLNSAATLLGKAFEGNTGTLSRYGIQVSKNLDPTKKFSQVLQEVQSKFGGASTAQAETFTGQMKLLGDAFNHLQEEIGKLLAGESGGIVKWITSLVQKTTEALQVIDNARARFASLSDFLKTFAVSILGTVILTILTIVEKVIEADQIIYSTITQGLQGIMTPIITFIGDILAKIPIVGGSLKQQLDTAFAVWSAGTNIVATGMGMAATGVGKVKTAVEDQIVAMQAQKLQSAEVTQIMLTNEEKKVKEFHNTYTQWQAITDQQSLYTKDKLAEEMKLRTEQAANLKAAQLDFARNFVTSQADMWTAAGGFADHFMSGFANGFAMMIMQGKSFSDSMKALFRDIATEIISWIIKMIIKMLIFLALREAAEKFGPVGQAISSALGVVASAGALTHAASGGTINEPSIITGLRSGKQIMAGEAGPESISPLHATDGGSGGGGGITVNISGQFIEGDPASWQKLINEKIVPAIRRFTMATPTGPFTRRRGVA